MTRLSALTGILTMLLFTVPACMDDDLAEDGENDAFANGKADGGIDEGSPEALGVLALVNDPTLTASDLKTIAQVTSKVATNIVSHRNGADGQSGTSDDNKYDDLAELDKIPFVGPKTLAALLGAAKDRGLVASGAKIDVIFSPQVAADSHNARIAKLIREATTSIDIAQYSYSDAGIAAALRDAKARGVTIRFLFETANADKGITDPAARAASKSGRIEADGIDVRFVNKILHHKLVIIDGPRDDISLAGTTKIVTGSANWSNNGATIFDENTFIIESSEKLSALYQQEFDALWVGSRDFVGPATAQPASTAGISPDDVLDEAGVGALFTRANMKPGGADGATWSTDKDSLAVATKWVEAINNAQTSIHIASGHMRLRPVAEALLAKKQSNPSVDIKVYVDQQEWISVTGDQAQNLKVATCKANATTPAQLRDCGYNDFLFAKSLVDGGIDLRFKAYAYRWDASYAPQMHSKYMIVDGSELISGSYNLSMNSEHGTFENALHLTGPQFKPLLAKFEQNFATIFETGRSQNLLASLRSEISSAQTIPLVFDSMALTWSEFDQLRVLIRKNCTQVDSTEFRQNAPGHKVCPRL
jgi:phosphatidylserine/phosphatidylglycerophosphate/cardiolipin synthase-like enzyme